MNTYKNILSFVVVFAFFFLISFVTLAHSSGYRSNVADLANKLREVAGKDRNIGQEISEIAKEQEEAVEEVEMAKEEVEEKGRFRVFLTGTDYKNIGVLRSKLVTTENHIERLIKAIEKATDPAVKAELEQQMSELRDIKLEVEMFIKDHENQFSILGWLFKLFNR